MVIKRPVSNFGGNQSDFALGHNGNTRKIGSLFIHGLINSDSFSSFNGNDIHRSGHPLHWSIRARYPFFLKRQRVTSSVLLSDIIEDKRAIPQ